MSDQVESFGRSLFAAQVNDSGISNTQFVSNLYEGFLQRGPDAGGLGFWSGQATVGTGRQNVLNAFATSGGFYELAGTLYREAFWLVSDQPGTPRKVLGKSGSLASVKRHDYLPFGEELYAGMSGRTTTQGYTGDSVRQHFTGYETDAETGLNFAEARYQSNLQGRFTSVDPLGASASVGDPQSFNRYSYANNNPTNLTDPSGMLTPNPATGWIQTDDESYARTEQASSDAEFQHTVNNQYATEHGLSITQVPVGENNRGDWRNRNTVSQDPQDSPAATIMPGATPEQETRIQEGFDLAENLIKTVPTCSAFFGGAQNALRTLDFETAYKVDSSIDPTGSGHPQAKSILPTTYVLLNPKGGVFSAKDVSFDVVAPGSKLSQSFKITLSPKEAAAFIFAHETAHKTKPNRFGGTDNDAGRGDKYLLRGYQNNWKIWKACFANVKRSP